MLQPSGFKGSAQECAQLGVRGRGGGGAAERGGPRPPPPPRGRAPPRVRGAARAPQRRRVRAPAGRRRRLLVKAPQGRSQRAARPSRRTAAPHPCSHVSRPLRGACVRACARAGAGTGCRRASGRSTLASRTRAATPPSTSWPRCARQGAPLGAFSASWPPSPSPFLSPSPSPASFVPALPAPPALHAPCLYSPNQPPSERARACCPLSGYLAGVRRRRAGAADLCGVPVGERLRSVCPE